MNFKNMLATVSTLAVVTLSAEEFATKPGVFVTMKTTLGTMVIELNAELAPVSVDNFLSYCEEGFYNGLVFHRVIPTFMIQGGGFTTSIDKKEATKAPIINEWKNGLQNKNYTIAMARTSDPDSATSEFFINVADNGFLDQPRGGAAYAVFGKVVSGTDVVDKIKNTPCIAHPKYPAGEAVTPKANVEILSTTISGKFDRAAIKAAAVAAVKKIQTAKLAPIQGAIDELEKLTGKKMETTSSGLKYIISKKGSGPRPSGPSANVTVHYEGKLLNGTVFDSSYKRNQTIDFPLNGVIRGWTEGVQLMNVGGEAWFLIPPALGYGASGAGGAIPPNAWLIFKIELIKSN